MRTTSEIIWRRWCFLPMIDGIITYSEHTVSFCIRGLDRVPVLDNLFRRDWIGRVAQLAEHRRHKPGVTGSSPVPPTTFTIVY